MIKNKKFTAIDLFCGAGGLTLGLKNAGFTVLAGVELNKNAAIAYKTNHPTTKLFICDVKKLTGEDLFDTLGIKQGELDLLAGCPPCQGFSTQRTRNKNSSVEDERNNLIFDFLRIVKSILPKTILLENVPGLAKDWRIETLRGELHELGYIIDEQFLQIKDAANYGIPQRRRRLIVKASRFGIIKNPIENKIKTTVRTAIAHLPPPGLSGDKLHDSLSVHGERVKKIISLIPKNGGSRKDIPIEYWLECHKKNNSNSYSDVYGRMSWDDVAPTITGGCHNPSKGRFIHPEQNRGITLREAAILQSFPDNYIFPLDCGKSAVALMIGNALPPNFIKQHAIEYINHLKEIRYEFVA